MVLRLVAFALAFGSAAFAQRLEDQARKILADNCHGSAPMSGLSLRTRASILAGGTRGAALIPGKASESILYQAVAREGKLQMPPARIEARVRSERPDMGALPWQERQLSARILRT